MKTYTKPEIKTVELVIAEEIANAFDINEIVGGESNIGTFAYSFSSLQSM
ncbi:MAG: hypothetical protein J6Q52_00715 [Clostridia bacterium]|nr:hypothetical protein [Clostridia bacterium]